MPMWIIVVLLAAGAGVGLIEPGRLSYVFGHATLYIFLPPLLFEAAWNLDARAMLANWRPIFALAVPGVFITTAIVGGAIALTGFPLVQAFVIGAVVSATDPIAIVAIFRRLEVPAALSTIVQSEALLNDAMAVLVYRALLVALAATLSVTSVTAAAAIALVAALAGVGMGVAFAAAIAYIAVRRNGTAVQILATLCGAYGTYFIAEALHLSGIFAVVAFGIALGEIERRSISVRAAHDVGRFWDGAALLANVVVFFLTGAAIEITRLANEPVITVAALGAVLLARLVLAYAVTPLAIGRSAKKSWLHVVRVANARGALSLALALAVPYSVAARPQIIDVTFAVVLATLLSSAVSVPATLNRLRRSGPSF